VHDSEGQLQLESFLEESARRFPGKTALIFERQLIAYCDIETRCNRLAHAMLERGLRPGDRVAIWLENSPEVVIALFAALKAGAVFLVLNSTTKAEKIEYVLNNCRARALVTDRRRARSFQEHWSAVPHLEIAWITGESEMMDAQLTSKSLASLSQDFQNPALPASPPEKHAIDVDLAALIYTSGSAGVPKGVMMTHLSMISAATSITTYLESTSDDIVLNFLPLSFDYGLYQVLMAFKVGATLLLERSFTFPHPVLEAAARERITGLPIVPTVAALLLQMDVGRYDLSSLRYVTSTGAALPAEHIRRLREMFPQARIFSMYGLTECKRVSYLPPDQIDTRPTSVGRGMPNEEVYVVDEDGKRTGPGVIGELVVRGSNVMKGYWEDPVETAKRLRPGKYPWEQFLYTGDLFKTDSEGYLYFVGRKDDIIKSRDEKVSPKEVEDVLYRLDGVGEAAVVGVPDPILGQAVKAYITRRAGSNITESDVLRHCAQRLEDFMVPKTVEFRDYLPRTATGKVSKREISP
jgi:amino acid adenylation domain-containing protein